MNSCQDKPLPEWLKADIPAAGADDIKALVLFAHGAGADMDSDFMAAMAQRLCERGIAVVRFNFPYMQQRLLDGTRRPPNRAPALLACFEDAIALVTERFAPRHLFLMGKSMGGRMAAMLGADDTKARLSGIICLGYPFLPPKGKAVRLEPLQQCTLPLLIVQGERDSFGNRAQVASWDIPPAVNLHWVADGDHSLVPRKSSGHTEAGNLDAAADCCVGFMSSVMP